MWLKEALLLWKKVIDKSWGSIVRIKNNEPERRKTLLWTFMTSKDFDPPTFSRNLIRIFNGGILNRQGCKMTSCGQVRRYVFWRNGSFKLFSSVSLLLQNIPFLFFVPITKTRLYNFDPLKLTYIVKLGLTVVYINSFISAQNKNIDCGYLLEPPRRGGPNEYPQSTFWAEIWN